MPAVEMLTADEVRAIFREELERIVSDLRGAIGAPPDDLDTAAAAKIARVSVETVRDWVMNRGLRASRPPGARDLRIARADLTAFLASPLQRRPHRARGAIDLATEAERLLTRGRREG